MNTKAQRKKESKTGAIEIIVRGVITGNQKILLAHKKGAQNTFLPGGHINPGEGAKIALQREIKEELGLSCKIMRYLGTVEHTFEDKDGHHQEINLIFELKVRDLDTSKPLVSRETSLEFLWQPVSKLKGVNLQPYPLCELLPKWIKYKTATRWESSFE